jgi:hypothetical protein
MRDYHERLFLEANEAWHSQMDENSGNGHVDIPHIYIFLMHQN